ncbi:alcohol dehydrogenase, Zn-binding [Renibacterium salmoninarum ATCC 33209]|uniref:alcohol dehydrogenase n=1 Tax=Renibacterium salmoninarum (strain ATCC 33209 / DSM 20767 / JCM 11484 / NBRC 15589 / NCIMB 2235) TaxID=288705 RepID=A9WQJ4_RENSM|nr:zinc-binding dehydrogenase [Renibacterium salmoninarum]ABY22564.1 alcohol dehydrogenase, Zn-binding [Renibacterium salmoninarum ATCC 33209]
MENLAQVALWLGAGKGFELRKIPFPDLMPGQVLIAIEAACICGSDLHTVNGHRSAPAPSVLGHEYCGRVQALGPGQPPRTTSGEKLRLGDRVTWSVTDSCGQCLRCLRSLPQKYLNLAKYGHADWCDWPLSGGFASHIQLRSGTAIVLVPDEVSATVAATASCAGGTVMAEIDGAMPDDPGSSAALVIGAGMLGLYATAVLASRGFNVTVWEPRAQRRQQALRFGAQQALAGSTGSTGSTQFDLALELSGYRSTIPAAIAALEVGGTLVLVGTVAPGAEIALDPEFMVRNLLTIRSVHHYRPQHLQEAVEFLSTTDKPFAELISAPWPLAEIAAAFESAERGDLPRVAVTSRNSTLPSPESR